MPQADGSIIIDTKIDTSGFKELESVDLKGAVNDVSKSFKKLHDGLTDALDGVEVVNTGISQTGDILRKTENDVKSFWREVGDSFGSMFTASAAADLFVGAVQATGDAIKEFVAGSVEAAADVAAENAQFEQTFRELEDTAVDSLKSIEKQTGITASRMKSSYAKTFAFTKSIGADSEEAMDIANRAMLAAADSAAYYDKTIEEATETLQSFLKGNYENDAALGIAATETTRNAMANQLYAKSFNDLSEAQKVDTLLAMVEAGNKASGALGQAAREADSWTNVTGELNEAMKQLQAVVGGPAMEAMIPIIQGMTSAIKSLFDITDSEALQKNVDGLVQSLEDAEKKFADTEKQVQQNEAVAKLYVKRLKELEAGGLQTAEAQKQYAATVEALNELMPDLNLYIDEQTGLTNLNTDAIEFQIKAMKQKAMFAAYEEKYTAALRAQADASITAKEAERELYKVQEEKNILVQQLGGTVADYRDRLAEAERQLRLQYSSAGANVAITQEMIYTAAGLTEEQIRQYESLIKLTEEEGRFRRTMDDANAIIAEQDVVLKDVSDAMGELSAETGKAVGEIAQDAEALGDIVGERMAEKIAGNTGAIQKAFAALAKAGLASFAETIKNGGRVTSAGNNYEVSFDAYSLESAPTLRMMSAISTLSASGKLPQVPELAKGAVIPPNSRFMAVLGDQTHGVNVEAPLATIQEAVAVVMEDMVGGMMAGFENVVERQERIIEAIESMEIGDEVIFRAHKRYAEKLAIMRGGR